MEHLRPRRPARPRRAALFSAFLIAAASAVAIPAPPAGAALVPDGPLVDVGGDAVLSGPRGPRVVMQTDGGFTVVWLQDAPGGRRLAARGFAPGGVPLNGEVPLRSAEEVAGGEGMADVAGSGERFVVAWRQGLGAAFRVFAADGTPAGPEVEVPPAGALPPVTAIHDVAVAMGSEDALVVAWKQAQVDQNGTGPVAVYARRFTAGGADGEALLVDTRLLVGAVDVAATAEGDYAVTYEVLSQDGVSSSIAVALVDPGDGLRSTPFGGFDPPSPSQDAPSSAYGADRLLAVAYSDSGGQGTDGVDGSCTGAFVHFLFDDEVRPERVNPQAAGCQTSARVAAMGDDFLTAYLGPDGQVEEDAAGVAQRGVWLRLYEPARFGEVPDLVAPPVRVLAGPPRGAYDLAARADRAVVVAVLRTSPPSSDGLAQQEHRVVARLVARVPDPELVGPDAADLRCTPSEGADHLCLQGGRFRVDVDWRDPYTPSTGAASTGVARSSPFEGDASGTFWFFRRSNRELIVKVLDGRVLNDHWWLFHGALSTVEYWLTATDLETGGQYRYYNPPHALVNRADVTAFAATSGPQPLAADTGIEAVAPGRPRPSSDTAIAPCDTATQFCLHDRRFRVSVEWSDPRSGDSGFGQAVGISPNTGAFWFFRPGNAELLVKVLDGRAVNGHWWVFYSSLSDVEFRLTVDPPNIEPVVYVNPPFLFGGGAADTEAVPE